MQPPVGQLPTLCIPASESSSPCWYAMRGVLIPVTMIGAPSTLTAYFFATTLYLRATLDTRVSFDQCLTSPSHSIIRTFSVSHSLSLPDLTFGFGLYLSVTSVFGHSFC